jgi:hypothetical protein
MKEADGYMRYYDRIEPMRGLSDEEYGKVCRAVDEYAQYGVLPELPANLEPFFTFVKPSIDTGKIKYAETCAKNKYRVAVERYQKDDPKKPPFWEWWANDETYDENLFRKQAWYDLARELYHRIRTNTKTNTNQSRNQTNNNNDNERNLSIERESAQEKGCKGNTELTDDDIKVRLTEIIIQESGDREKGLRYAEQFFDTKNGIWGKTWGYYLESHIEPQMGLEESARYYANLRRKTEEQA